ncbi:hypothetical protein F5I97DRAFT_1855885 [Phlebopus sp. FC_14]|nr:hypothetical protein F5I97DRAFT_1855885 [Phlebopus sp. FC_14]
MAVVSAIQPSRPDHSAPSTLPSSLSPNLQLSFFQRGLAISDLDFKDNRYPSLAVDNPPHRTSSMILASHDTQAHVPPDQHKRPLLPSSLASQKEDRRQNGGHDDSHLTDINGAQQPSYPNVPPSTAPQGEALHLVERHSFDDNAPPVLNGNLIDSKFLNDSYRSLGESLTISQQQQTSSRPGPDRDLPMSLLPSMNQQPSHASPGAAGAPGLSPNGLSSPRPYNPALGIPISPNPRAYPQHPTYITPAAAPDPINPVLSPNLPHPPEEVCVECAMRDQDMADVIVIGPGIWDRESDVLYEELLRREEEEEAAGILSSECSTRARARGGRLTEPNLKLWNTMTPREPSSKQKALETYVKAQRSLLEADALARARAMQESIQLETTVRDTYTQLRRSAYEIGALDDGAFKLKPPRSASTPNGTGVHHVRSSSRDITLLENGLIVEHVDVRREEREEKERRRRQEKRERSRPRKSSRSSAVDVTSLYSSNSLAPYTDNGLGAMQSSRLSGISTRPTSSLTAPIDRQASLGQVCSQASFSDAHSPGSASPRRSRFFGFKNLSSAWRSQESLAPSGMSGSMMDMHVALQREANGPRVRSPAGMKSTLSTQRHSQLWPPPTNEEEQLATPVDERPKKKRNGLAKIWKLVKGSSHKEDVQIGIHDSGLLSPARNDDDLPLAPPPPLSYLVERGPGEHLGAGRHASTPSLPSTASPRNGLSSPGVSPPTAPSSLLPSPTSSRPSGGNGEMNDRKNSGQADEKEVLELCPDENGRLKVVHPVTSEPDIRQKLQQAMFASNNGMTLPNSTVSPQQMLLLRDKSLPPLPGEVKLRPQNNFAVEPRPQTLYTYDPRPNMQDLTPPHAPFRTEARRQSFGGTASRPSLGIQTMPATGGHDHLRAVDGKYNEFGTSRRSLGRLGDIDENAPAPATPTKRKSKFGFSSLLGKKSNPPEVNGYSSHEFPRLNTPVFDGNEDSLTSAYTSSTSRQGAGPRLSVISRKAIEERVEQDNEFVAYRYPSQSQPPIDLIR